MKRVVAGLAVSMLFIVSGCATSFSGSAKIDGPDECRKVCDGWGMDLAGMVAMGEYTDGCICKVKGDKLAVSDIGNAVISSSAAAAAGSAGVMMKMRDN